MKAGVTKAAGQQQIFQNQQKKETEKVHENAWTQQEPEENAKRTKSTRGATSLKKSKSLHSSKRGGDYEQETISKCEAFMRFLADQKRRITQSGNDPYAIVKLRPSSSLYIYRNTYIIPVYF